MASMRDRLSAEGVLATAGASGTVADLLAGLQIQSTTPVSVGREEGTVNLGVNERALGIFDLNLKPPGDDRKYVLTFDGPSGARTGFRLAVSLNEGPQAPLFKLVQGLPGHVLKAAAKKTSAEFRVAGGGTGRRGSPRGRHHRARLQGQGGRYDRGLGVAQHGAAG